VTLLTRNLTAGLGVAVSGADLLVSSLALLLLHGGALPLLDSLSHWPLNILAVGLWDIAALLLGLSPALLLGVVHSVTALGVLSPALLLVVSLLDRFGDSPALPILNILTALLGDIVTFLTRDILISCLLLLATVLDRLLGALLRAHRLVDSLLHVLALLLRHAATTLLLAGAGGATLELRLQKTKLSAAEEAELEVAKAKKLLGDTNKRQQKTRGEDKLHLEGSKCSYNY